MDTRVKDLRLGDAVMQGGSLRRVIGLRAVWAEFDLAIEVTFNTGFGEPIETERYNTDKTLFVFENERKL